MKNSATKAAQNKRLAVLAIIARAAAEDLKEALAALPTFTDEPAARPLSPKIDRLQRATLFCGYWSVSAYLGALKELAHLIETEPTEKAGRPELLSRIQALSAGFKSLGSYLQAVAKGVNSSNVELNESFRVVVRKVRPHLLDMTPELSRDIFFMAVPLSLEMEALWSPKSQASRGALIAAIKSYLQGSGTYAAMADANPYASLSGLFDGLATQPEFSDNPANRTVITGALNAVLSTIEGCDPIIPPHPGAFLLSQLLYAAAHNLSGDDAAERYRLRYALLHPGVMKAEDGLVSMHGLATEFTGKLKDLTDTYTQAAVLRNVAQIKPITAFVRMMADRLGIDSCEQLAIGFAEASETILKAEEAAAASPDAASTPETTEAWIRGAQVLVLIRHAVETWHIEATQQELLALASELNFSSGLSACRSLQLQNRQAAVGRALASILKDLSGLQASITNAMRQAAGQAMSPEVAHRAVEAIGRPNSAIFQQASGLMDILELPVGREYAQRIIRDLVKEDTWAQNSSRMALFESIAGYSEFLSRLRASALQDLEPEEMGDESEDVHAENADLPSMCIFDMEPTEVVELSGGAWADESIALEAETSDQEAAPAADEAVDLAEDEQHSVLRQEQEQAQAQKQEYAEVVQPEANQPEEDLAPTDVSTAAAIVAISPEPSASLSTDGCADGAPSDGVSLHVAEVADIAFTSADRSPEALIRQFLAEPVDIQDDMRSLDEELATVMSEEARGCLEAIGTGLAGVEASQHDDEEAASLMDDIKRHIHTIKGVSRTSGLMRAGSVFHAMEDEMDLLGDDVKQFQTLLPAYRAALEHAEALLAPLFSSLHDLSASNLEMVAAARDVSSPPVPMADQAGSLEEAPVELPAPTEDAEPAPEIIPEITHELTNETLESNAVQSRPQGERTKDKVRSDATVRLPLELVNQVGAASGGVLAAERRLRASIERLRKIARSLDVNIRRMNASIRDIEIKAAASIAASSASISGSTDFDPLELDRYTDLQERVRTLSETHRDVLADIDELNATLADVDRDEGDLQEVSDELQRESSGMLLTPLISQAGRLSSVVKRAGADAGKQVDLQIARDCRLPAAALDKLMPVFEHLLRNSVAHGIESDRAAAGKPATGTITISPAKGAAEVAGTVTLSVRDDGAGIDAQRVLAIAQRKGLAKEGTAYSQDQIHEFIFAPGFSTAASVTQLAGRGVGLDVVRDAISRLGGVVSVASTPGRGTEFTLTIPTDFSTMAVLPVRSGSVNLLIPVSMIHEVLPLSASASGRLSLRDGSHYLDGHRLEIVRLSTKVGGSRAGQSGSGYLVVMRGGGASKAVEVDAVDAQYRATVTPLGPYVRGIPGLLAGTIYQGGTVGLIVNPLRMLDAAAAGSEQAQAARKEAACLMVVDDSPSMRMVTERAIKRLGYRCVTANDGLDALDKLSSGIRIDGFLVDLEMPGMDGFTLIAELRRSQAYEATPIVVISSRTAQKHLERAIQAGANEYLAKPYDETELTRVVERYITRERAAA